MAGYVKISSYWRTATSYYVKTSSSWRTVSDGYVKISGAWSRFFQSVLTPSIQSTVTISRNNAEYPSTLTGTNFYWTNSTSLTYVFQKSSDNVTFTNIGSATSIANPSPSSSNTVTYVLTLADMPSVLSYYRFVVTASNSTYSTSATSTSSSVTVISRPSGGTVSLSPTGTQYDGTTLTASTTGWSGSPSSYSVRIYAAISNPPTTSGILKATSSSSSVTYTITQSDAAAPAYYFKAFATATNSGGTSSEEPGSNVVLSVAKTVPGLVTSFTANSSLSGSNLNWSASWSAPSSDGGASITGYKVYVERSSSSSGPWTATATQIPAGSGSYTAASPYSTASQSVTGRVISTSSTWIRVWVAAVNSVGTGTYTSAVG